MLDLATTVRIRRIMRITVLDLGSGKSVDSDVADSAVIYIHPSPRAPKILSVSLTRPIPIADCPSCGSPTAPGASFCVYCGSKLPRVTRSPDSS